MNARPPHLSASILSTPNVIHGFFGRKGGVSEGIYASLNTGFGSDDDRKAVAENRRRCAGVLGVPAERLLTANQTHSPNAIVVTRAWDANPAQADALVTTTPGLAVGALAADCMPWLLVDRRAGVAAAAHAGWRGALAGVLENTVALMAECGAKPSRIHAALGPCLRQPNFEVGLDLLEAFRARHQQAERFFKPGKSTDKRQFDLAGFGAWRLRETGVEQIEDLGVCTLAMPDHYYSYRAVIRAGGREYGRNLSAIALV